MIFHSIRDKIQIITNLDPDLPSFRISSVKISQVFLNLIKNAIQAISEKGKITVNSYYSKKNVFFEIIDDGIGIPEEEMAKVFNPFFTTKDVGEGTGLGLHISQSIVQGYGGKILVDSQPGKGTKFTVQLPIP